MESTPLALPPVLPTELLTYLLRHHASPTTVLICQPRTNFLNSLFRALHQSTPHEARASVPEDGNSTSPQQEEPAVPERHPLLIPTLHQIATSRHIKTVFIPTISHLRAYLSVSPPISGDSPLERVFEKLGSDKPSLVVYGMLELHRDTSEWSAQGLGNSLASLVEAGWRSSRRVVLLEKRKMSDDFDDDQTDDETEGGQDGRVRKHGLKVWEEKVPMLNRSVRRPGFDGEDSGWSGRTIEVGRILARWFRFERE